MLFSTSGQDRKEKRHRLYANLVQIEFGNVPDGRIGWEEEEEEKGALYSRRAGDGSEWRIEALLRFMNTEMGNWE